MDKLVTLLFRLNPKWRKQLKVTAAQNNTSVQKLVEEALEANEKTKFKSQ